MSTTYVIDWASNQITKRTQGPPLFSAGSVTLERILRPHRHQVPLSTRTQQAADSAAWLIVHDCADTAGLALEEWAACADRHHIALADQIIRPLLSDTTPVVQWDAVQKWVDRVEIGRTGSIAATYERVVSHETALHEALTGIPQLDGPPPWELWDVGGLYTACVATMEQSRRSRLPRFIEYILDLKFKLCCILGIDIPRFWELAKANAFDSKTPHYTPYANLASLSTRTTVIIKSRSAWETLMNAVYYLEEGKELRTSNKYRSKKAVFFKWVDSVAAWQALKSFSPIVQDFDAKLRTPEVHSDSRLRSGLLSLADPTPETILLNTVLHYAWDHFTGALVFERVVEYDAAAGTGLTITDRSVSNQPRVLTPVRSSRP